MKNESQPVGPRLIGYVRVSTSEQKTDLQVDAMKAANCHIIFEDKLSGTCWTRAGLDRALAEVRTGDKLVVWKLDRLARSIQQILAIITDLEKRGASLVSLTEAFDTGTESGQLHSTILAMVAHIERRMIVSRTKAGLQAARERGVHLGPAFKLAPLQIAKARAMHKSGVKPEAIRAHYGVSRATIYRYLASKSRTETASTIIL